MKRLVLCTLYYGFARWLPVSHVPGGAAFKWIRYQICRRLFAECGKNVNVESGAAFHSGRHISIGDHSGIGKNALIEGPVKIGCNVMMGPNVTIWTRNHAFDRLDVPMCEQGFLGDQPVEIGDDVWIGSHVIILPGVKLGKGCIIGAGAVVPKSIPEYGVAVGNPAKIVKYRNAGKTETKKTEPESAARERRQPPYSGVISQQGRVPTDKDMNEQSELSKKKQEEIRR